MQDQDNSLHSKSNKPAASRNYKALALLVPAILLLLTFTTYKELDSSYNRAASDEIDNLLGWYGAYIADPILQFLGLIAPLFALMLLVVGLRSYSKINQHNNNTNKALQILLSTIFMLPSGAIVLACLPVPEFWPFYVGLSGVAGDLLLASLPWDLPNYANGLIFMPLFLVSAYFAFACNKAELTSFYNLLKLITYRTARAFKISAVIIFNSYLKLTNKELVKVQAPKKIVIKQDIVEFKPEVKKKKQPQQTVLKLDADEFELPELDLLTDPQKIRRHKTEITQKSLEQNAKLLKKVLEDFGIEGEIVKVRPGPVVTLYELEPSPGTKSSRVIGLSDDIARSMSSVSARIAVVPGRNILGIELPNVDRETVLLRELLEIEEYKDKRIKLPIALGKDIGGEPVTADLARMPHLLIAGTTGSGKSVAVNAMILSFLYRLTPEECKFIMIDPKMLELSVYDGIPHLIAPVVTEPGKAVVALKWAVKEMEHRYRLMSNLGVRNIAGYNKAIEDAQKSGAVLERKVQTGFNPETGEPIIEKQPLEMIKLPFIVIIVDEMADLMLTAGKDIEASIQRLAQMARAAGLHMVMATQRPSVDVITGVIKANFPTRISFQVTSRIDSRTILSEMGAEQLLGMGDMLYMAGGGRITRVHGPFVDDKEVEKVVSHLKAQGTPKYIEDITKEDEEMLEGEAEDDNSEDGLYQKAVTIVLRDKKTSISYVQRQLRIGYNKAANLIERMEREGVLSAAGHSGKREIL